MTADIEVGLVGLGVISETHLSVLAEFPRVILSFLVDPDPDKPVSFKGVSPPRYTGIGDALGEHRPDLVVIASPTHTHADIARAVLTETAARVLVEKPFVHDLDALAMIRSLEPAIDLRSRVAVAHHFAFSPEVRWGADLLAQHPEWGPVTRITSVFHDAYIVNAEHSFAAYASSWIDSGINQLSVLARFVDLVERGELHESDGGASAWCTVGFRSGTTAGSALLRTSWQAVASSKKTTLELAEPGIEIWLDHTALTGVVERDSQVSESLVNDGLTPRKIAHYRPLYENLLSDKPDPILGFDAASSVVELLYGQ